MVLRFFPLAGVFLLASCADFERNNPEDPGSSKYVGNQLSSSSSVEPSSSSVWVPPLSSVTVPSSSSSAVATLSSSSTKQSSSSNFTPSSSSVVVVILSSSSVTVSSSSSSAPSSSSVSVSSSSSVPIQSNVVYGTPVTYEGETYQTVVIGTQTWIARNLNYNASGSKCHDNKESNCAIYGRLYNWATAMDLPASCNSASCASQVDTKHRGICPEGWYIPSNADWDILVTAVGGESTAGKYLKATSGGWANGGNGEDKYGFSALPGGYGYSGVGFSGVGSNGVWWSSSESNADYVYSKRMNYLAEDIILSSNVKGNLLSIRCVKD